MSVSHRCQISYSFDIQKVTILSLVNSDRVLSSNCLAVNFYKRVEIAPRMKDAQFAGVSASVTVLK